MIEQNQKHIPHAQYTGIEIEEDFFGDYNMTKKNITNYLILEVMLESLIFKIVLWSLQYLLYNLCHQKIDKMFSIEFTKV